ncbi:cuticle protein 16.8 [Trichonephila clavipes]|nr:cuticle protein 16.8 [Trichonephila clavipes]
MMGKAYIVQLSIRDLSCMSRCSGQGGHFDAFILAALSMTASANLHESIHHHASKPFKLKKSIKDYHGEQHREESGNGGHAVRESYRFTDARGICREINYVADHGGFRAQIKTNKPGTANQNSAAVHLISDAPYGHGGYAGAAGLGYAGVVGGPVGYADLGGEGPTPPRYKAWLLK